MELCEFIASIEGHYMETKGKFRVLDLFCGAGGAGYGFYLAGFSVVGVDINPQPHYPFEFHRGDALKFLEEHGKEFDYIHASPPCQAHSAMTRGRWKDRISNHPQLIEPVRELLLKIGKPFDIENVPGAPLRNPVVLCGTMFNLETKHGSQLRRHRLFETNWEVGEIPLCNHNKYSAIGVYGGGQNPSRKKIPATVGVYGNSGGSSKRDGVQMFGIQDRRDAMGIQWMTGKELSQAIPPAYTKFLAERWLQSIGVSF
jgi:DNA (cytosine-5)-methyltransferase 1